VAPSWDQLFDRHHENRGSAHGLEGSEQRPDRIRIDHLMLSPQAADRLADAGIDRHVRGWDKPSDHVPVYVDLDIEGR